MVKSQSPLISIAVPLYNESAGIVSFHNELTKVAITATGNSYEIIYCDDGSNDNTVELVQEIAEKNRHVRLVALSRNFGKESALSAAIHAATGQAVIMLDGDGQHPIALIPAFVKAWQAGAKVVIGLRTEKDSEAFTKRLVSKMFYALFNRFTDQHLIPGTTDYRLIDRAVQQAFLHLPETDRITRGLIDWLGFTRAYIPIPRLARAAGTPSYSWRKLALLATNSFVSLTVAPLYLFGILGLIITVIAFILGIAVFIEQIILHDPLRWAFTGTAMLGILTLFLVGIILISQGIISLYLSRTHSQTKQRPLYIINYDMSARIGDTSDD
ncbi:MAG TPA: glycosyltransferase family 2 protein [Candidatus Saccharimonadales bacterium]